MIATQQTLKAELGIQVGHEIYSCPKDYITEVTRLSTWTPAPASPQYVPGTVEISGRICTAIDIQQIQEASTSETPLRIEKENCIGLVLEHPSYHPIILVGQRAVSFPHTDSSEWRPIELPAPFKKQADAPDILFIKNT